MLASVAKTAKVSFQVATSAFDEAAKKFDFVKDSQYPKRRLNTRAIAYARGEQYEAAKQQTAAKRAAAESKLHSKEEVFSGLVVDLLEGITEARAREILEYFVASGDYQILPQDIEPILKKLYHSELVPTSTERKQKSRAIQRLGRRHTFDPSSLRRDGSKKKKGN